MCQFKLISGFRSPVVGRKQVERIFRFYYNFLGCYGHRFCALVFTLQSKPLAFLPHVQRIYHLPVHRCSKGRGETQVVRGKSKAEEAKRVKNEKDDRKLEKKGLLAIKYGDQ